ncbi:MAG: cyanophycinase [Gemmatimonadaceae bacterium]|nr:cyanophycinase [Gemmatimonadaceae bacterium]
MTRLLCAILVTVASCVTVSLTAQSPAPTRGTLYIVGGGPQPAALVQEFVDLAGGRGKARIVVFAMASASGARSGEAKAADLRALGAEARNVWITREQAMTDSVARLLDGVTGVWFGGGDQNRLANVLRGTPTERAIHARYAAGAVIGGTSAGAAVMSAVMITGSERTPGGARPDTTLDWVTIARDNTATTDGFSLMDNAVIDQHFLRRKRHNRLISLVLERAPHLGAGIDESTALVVRADGTWQVRGASVVVIYDARQATVSPVGLVLGASGMRVHVLPAGSTFDPRTGTSVLGAPPR